MILRPGRCELNNPIPVQLQNRRDPLVPKMRAEQLTKIGRGLGFDPVFPLDQVAARKPGVSRKKKVVTPSPLLNLKENRLRIGLIHLSDHAVNQVRRELLDGHGKLFGA